MPFVENQNIDSPASWNHPIWRYLSTSQLISILVNDKLHFTRTDQFNDPYEGDLPADPEDILADDRRDGGLVGSFTKHEDGEIFLDGPYDKIETFKKAYFHNSWNYKKYESKSMWDSKSRDGEGVAIKTTPQNLKESFNAFPERNVYIGMVEYGNYQGPYNEEIDVGSWLNVHLHKPIEFEEERELRASLTTYPTPSADPFYDYSEITHSETVELNWDDQPPGVQVPIHTDILIDEIRLSPYSDKWQVEVFEQLLTDFNIDARVTESRIY